MKGFHFYLSVTLVLISGFAAAQNTGTPPGTSPGQGSNSGSSEQKGGAMASSGAIKVLAPKPDEKVGASAVTLRFQLVNTGLSPDPSPTYRVQLDSRDPVEMTGTEYSFTGLAAGDHVITIDLVDANHTPVSGSHTEVRFKTENQGAKPAAAGETSALLPPQVRRAALPLPPGDAADELPSAGGELPLLSMVGFGVLIGGVISAMRTRR